MGLFDDAVPGGNITKPLMIALGTLLIGKMMSGRSTSQSTAPMPETVPQPQQGGSLTGGLGGLLDKLTNAGHSDVVNSWLGPGQNAPIPPDKLGSALGQTTISDLARSAGISEQELLLQLSRVLPGVVDKLTPSGRIPNTAEIEAALNR